MKTLFILTTILFTNFILTQDLNLDKYCKKIDYSIDKFDGSITYKSPINKQICFIKLKKDKQVTFYMRIKTIGATPNTGTGVKLLLDNNQVIEKNIQTDVNVNSNAQFVHTAFFKLNEDDITLLKQYKITNVRLFVVDATIYNPEQYMAFLICLHEKL